VQGDSMTRLKQCDKITEKDYDRFVPLIPFIEESIQDPEKIVMQHFSIGQDSKQMMRDLQPKYNKR
jgi:hypothetical protein